MRLTGIIPIISYPQLKRSKNKSSMVFYYKKRFLLKGYFILFFSIFFISLSAQDIDIGEVDGISVKSRENTFSLFLNTHGGGLGFQIGKLPNHYDKHYWEVDFLYSIHYKSVRAKNTYWADARSFCYGKQYDLFFLRTGYGYQRIISHKPYWGGVEARYFISGGFALGIGLPVYLEILYYTYPDYTFHYQVEQYDPEKHDVSNIIGSAEWYRRFHKIALRPGFYAKSGFSFDFSKNEYRVRVLEAGISVDVIFPAIQQMAYSKSQNLFFCFYVAYTFGRKKGLYE